VDVTDRILVDDYIDGPTTATPFSYIPFSTLDTLSGATTSFNLNNSTTAVHPGTRMLRDHNSSPAAYGGGNTFLPPIAGTNGIMYIGDLAQADRPRLPYRPVMTRTKAVLPNSAIIDMEHTRGFANGQQILIKTGAATYDVKTINAVPTPHSISIAPSAPAGGYPADTEIIRLDGVTTTLTVAAAAAAAGRTSSLLDVASVDGFKVGNYIISGIPGDPAMKFHRIVRIVRNTAPATNRLVIEPPLGAGGLAINTPLAQVGGRLKTFVLAEVTPHDGLLAGTKPEDNNNISYKEVTFGHEILFTDSTGHMPLPKQLQVANGGADLTTSFRIYVNDNDPFAVNNTVITITRKLRDGSYQSETYYYKTSAPAGWKRQPNTAVWFTIAAPKLSSTNAAATGNQTAIYFEASVTTNQTIEEVTITVNAAGNDPHPLGAQNFITDATHVIGIFAVPGLPDINDANLQDQTGMPALAGTQMMHAFADMTHLEQPEALAYGPKNANQFRLTSSFHTNATPAAVVNAFAVVDGVVFLQRNIANNTINLVLKPLKQAEIGFNRVKYFIYRGLKEADFIAPAFPDNLIENAVLNPNAHFVDSVIDTQHRLNPGPPPPPVLLTQLGWNPTVQHDTDLLDNFFFPSGSLPVVKRGMTLGTFKNQEFGFEIVLAEGSYPITLANVRQNQYTLDVTAIVSADVKAAKREEILNYIDPAAYYGMHYIPGVLYPTLPDPDAAAINNERKDKLDLYTLILDKFFTKNTLYIDVRNENGYSYNYYGNYTQRTGSDLGKSIRAGFKPPTAQALTTSTYSSQEWPIMIYNNTTAPEDNPEAMSVAYLQLSTADNGNPVAFFEYGNVVSATTANNFAETDNLLETTAITAITQATNTITVNGAATGLAVGDTFYVIGCDHLETNSMYKVIAKAPNAIDIAHTDLTVETGTLNYAAASGPALGSIHFNKWTKVIAVSYPNHTTSTANQKLNVAHVLKIRYFRQQQETGKRIQSIDQGAKRFTVNGTLARLLSPGDKLIITDASTANNGTYTIAANGVLQTGNDTQITVVETIPAAFNAAAGAHNGLVKIKPSRVPATGHYTDHKFGSLNAVTRQIKILSLTVNSSVQSVITLSGDYQSTLLRNTRLTITGASVASNNGNYVITNVALVTGNTQITITTTASLSTSISPDADKDLISVLALPWHSDHATQWLSGFDFRYLDARKQLTDAADIPRDGFAYMGQTGVAIEQDRMIFQMTPLSFFKTPADVFTPNVINMNGGTSSEQSFWAVMQQQNQSLVINATMLQINPGPLVLPVFDFVDNQSDAIADDPMKSNFLALCITQAEFMRLKEAADAALNGLHDTYIVLRKEKRATDLNGVPYRSFELAVSGFAYKADQSLAAHEVYPASAVTVYCLREDSVIFTSKDFADLEDTQRRTALFEETLRMNASALNVYALNPAMQAHISSFSTNINALDYDYSAIKLLVEQRADALWNMAVTSADQAGVRPYDDRQLYWARLHGRNAIREHATLLLQFRRRRELVQLFDERSRGFHTVNYAGAPAGALKILVVGFDPFQLDPGAGGNPLQSNPSGAIALHMHGKTLVKGPKQAYVQSVIFPVRFGDFDAGLVERIITQIQAANNLDMIVTCSQDLGNYFNIDRFASQFRNPNSVDNENKPGNRPNYYRVDGTGRRQRTNAGMLPQFLETNLPFDSMDDTVGNTRPSGSTAQIAVFNQQWSGTQPDGTTVHNTHSWDPDNGGYNPANAEAPPAGNIRATEGSGGTYLSNEIFYRVALMRTHAIIFPRTGHLHVPLIQRSPADFSSSDTQTVVQNAKTIITDALTGL